MPLQRSHLHFFTSNTKVCPATNFVSYTNPPSIASWVLFVNTVFMHTTFMNTVPGVLPSWIQFQEYYLHEYYLHECIFMNSISIIAGIRFSWLSCYLCYLSPTNCMSPVCLQCLASQHSMYWRLRGLLSHRSSCRGIQWPTTSRNPFPTVTKIGTVTRSNSASFWSWIQWLLWLPGIDMSSESWLVEVPAIWTNGRRALM